MDTVFTSRGAIAPPWLQRALPQYAGNPRLLLYVLAVVGSGLVLFLWPWAREVHPASISFLIWLGLSVAAELLWLETLSGHCTDSMASTVNFAVIFLFPSPTAIWIIGISVLLATRFIQKRDWVHSVFGFGQMAVTAFLCGLVFRAGHAQAVTLESFRLPAALLMLASGVVYFVVNTGLVSAAVSLEYRSPLWKTWLRDYGYRNSIVSSIALFTLSPILILSYLSIGYPGVLLFFLPLFIIKNQNREYINLQKMTQALITTERMAAKGEMAAEVAHELRNYLAVLSGRTQLLLLRAGKAGDETMRADADIIRQQIQKMSKLAEGLLGFSHKEIHVQAFDLNKLVSDAVEFVRPQNLFDRVTLEAELDPEVAELQADPGQVQQVLINLLRNAAEAIRDQARAAGAAAEGGPPAKGAPKPPSAEGSSTDAVATAEEPARQSRITVRTGRGLRGYTRVTVEDNGPGMPKEVQTKVFEPAFTTKPDGHGYGLATCYRILQNHGGRIWVDSQVGVGSSFHMELPRKAKVNV